MENHGTPWNIMEHHGTPWNTMEHHGTPWNTMEHSGTLNNIIKTCRRGTSVHEVDRSVCMVVFHGATTSHFNHFYHPSTYQQHLPPSNNHPPTKPPTNTTTHQHSRRLKGIRLVRAPLRSHHL